MYISSGMIFLICMICMFSKKEIIEETYSPQKWTPYIPPSKGEVLRGKITDFILTWSFMIGILYLIMFFITGEW